MPKSPAFARIKYDVLQIVNAFPESKLCTYRVTDILGRRKFDKKITTSNLKLDQLLDRRAAWAA